MLNPGIKGSASVAVTAANTAAAMGSGELNVFATPALAALVEKACWQSVAPELDPGCGTVGTKLELAHNAPTPVGMMVRCESELTAVDGRKLTFIAVMYDDVGEVGRATTSALSSRTKSSRRKPTPKRPPNNHSGNSKHSFSNSPTRILRVGLLLCAGACPQCFFAVEVRLFFRLYRAFWGFCAQRQKVRVPSDTIITPCTQHG